MSEMVKQEIDLEGRPATLAILGAVEVLDEGDGRYVITGPDLLGEGVSRDTLLTLQAMLNTLLPTIA